MTYRWTALILAAGLVFGQAAVHGQQREDPPDSQAGAAEKPDEGRESFVAKLRRIADETRILGRLNGDVDGWYPRLGGMTTGSGFALGPGYRTRVADGRILLDASAGISTRGYKAADFRTEWLRSRFQRVELWTSFRYQDFPQEDFYGLGTGSSLDARTNYALESSEFTTLGAFDVRPWLRAGAQIGYFLPGIGPGTDSRFPSTELVFGDASAPGLHDQPDFLHLTLFSQVDYRDQPGNPATGGYYHLSFANWDDRTLQQFDFHRIDGEVAQFVPLAGRTHVLAGHLGFAYVNNTTGRRVPFYFLPYIGGSQTVRGFREFRFKDENALWLNTEYRWAALTWLNVALFFDAGEVRADWEDIDLHDLRTSYGFGVRVNSAKNVFARLDFGFGGDEGRQIFFKLGPSF